jgi:uncharacterized repeat protein (TIGR01451 family)
MGPISKGPIRHRLITGAGLVALSTGLFVSTTALAAGASSDTDRHVSDKTPIHDVLPSIAVTKSDGGLELPEPGGIAAYVVTVKNTGSSAVTVTAISDQLVNLNKTIDITTVNEWVVYTTCDTLVGTALAPSATASCTFEIPVYGDAGYVKTDKVTVTATDAAKKTATASATDTTPVYDVLPSIEVTKSDNGATVTAPGGNVTYSVSVHNTSVEAVTMTEVWDVIDSEWLDLSTPNGPIVATDCGDLVGEQLAIDGVANCAFTLHLTGAAGTSVKDTVAIAVVDNENNCVKGYGSDETPLVAPIVTTTTAAPTTTAKAIVPATAAPTTAAPATTETVAVEVLAETATAAPQLAYTGSDTKPLLLGGLGLTVTGMALVATELSGRRRRLVATIRTHG